LTVLKHAGGTETFDAYTWGCTAEPYEMAIC
jgi:hypothetical protein